MVCLQETKIKEMTQRVTHSLRVERFLGWRAVQALRASRGMVVLWDTRVLQLMGTE